MIVRFRGGSRDVDLELPHDLRTWLPGDDQAFADELVLPPGIGTGTYELQFGIVRRGETIPAVKMANACRSPEGWLRIGSLDIRT